MKCSVKSCAILRLNCRYIGYYFMSRASPPRSRLTGIMNRQGVACRLADDHFRSGAAQTEGTGRALLRLPHFAQRLISLSDVNVFLSFVFAFLWGAFGCGPFQGEKRPHGTNFGLCPRQQSRPSPRRWRRPSDRSDPGYAHSHRLKIVAPTPTTASTGHATPRNMVSISPPQPGAGVPSLVDHRAVAAPH